MQWFLSQSFGFQLLLVYVVVITAVTFFAFGMDKGKSERGERRTSEKTLWILSFIGGSIGALLGMNFFRHKTKKVSFQAGMIVIIALQVCVVVWLFMK